MSNSKPQRFGRIWKKNWEFGVRKFRRVSPSNEGAVRRNPPGLQGSKKATNLIAVGVGAGLRFDFSFLVLRTDLAFPLRIPSLPDGQRWVIDKVNFGNGPWRSDNLMFNLAIGYPF